MSNFLWKQRKAFLENPEILPREEKIQHTVKIAMADLALSQAQEPINLWEFLCFQSRYIHKIWWLLQALLLVVVYGAVRELREPVLIRKTLGVGAPLFIVLVIPELWRNQSSHAVDVESATMYTLRQLYAARLTLFAGVDLVLLTIFCFGAASCMVLTPWELITEFVLPVNVTACICLTCLYLPRGNHQGLPITLCLAFAAIWKEIVSSEPLYAAVTIPAWAGMLGVSFFYMVYCIFWGQKNWKRHMEKNLAAY